MSMLCSVPGGMSGLGALGDDASDLSTFRQTRDAARYWYEQGDLSTGDSKLADAKSQWDASSYIRFYANDPTQELLSIRNDLAARQASAQIRASEGSFRAMSHADDAGLLGGQVGSGPKIAFTSRLYAIERLPLGTPQQGAYADAQAQRLKGDMESSGLSWDDDQDPDWLTSQVIFERIAAARSRALVAMGDVSSAALDQPSPTVAMATAIPGAVGERAGEIARGKVFTPEQCRVLGIAPENCPGWQAGLENLPNALCSKLPYPLDWLCKNPGYGVAAAAGVVTLPWTLPWLVKLVAGTARASKAGA